MKNSHIASFIALLTTGVCAGLPASAQDFLSTPTAQAPTFLNNAFSSGGATGVANNSSNLLTGPGALNAGLRAGRSLSLPRAGFANMAPQSVNSAAFPSGQFNYGFAQPAAITLYPGAAANSYGTYGGQSLPTVSTGSVDINTVDCPYLRASYGTGTSVVNPWTINLNVFGTNTAVNFEETANTAESFLNAIGL